MKITVLDFTGCEYASDIQERIRGAFEFPEWYGANWDAFWDLLKTESDTEKLIIKGTAVLPGELKAYISVMYGLLEDYMAFCKEIGFSFSYETAD